MADDDAVFPPDDGPVSEWQDPGEPGDGEPATEPPIRGDHQLSLNLGSVSRAKKVEEATIKLSAAERPIDGLLAVDEEYTMVVRVKPKHYLTVPIRKDGKTRAWKQVQPVDVLSVRRADATSLVTDGFAEIVGRDEAEAGRLLEDLAAFLSEDVQQAA